MAKNRSAMNMLADSLSGYRVGRDPVLERQNERTQKFTDWIEEKDNNALNEMKKEQNTLNVFELQIDRDIKNRFEAGTIYDDEAINESIEFMDDKYNIFIDNNPELISEARDLIDARKEKYKTLKSKNKEWAELDTAVPIAIKDLEDLTEELTKIDWNNVTQETKESYKERLRSSVKTVSNLKRVLGDEYNKHRGGHAELNNTVDNIINGKKALLKQLNLYDPGKMIVRTDEYAAMEDALNTGDYSSIQSIEDYDHHYSIKRRRDKEQKLEKNVKDWNKLNDATLASSVIQARDEAFAVIK